MAGLSIDVNEWKIGEKDGVKLIGGEYVIKSGAAEVARKDFNLGYSCQKIPFSASLLMEAEELGKKVVAEVKAHFLGKEE